jgi:hypothetical protein
VNAGLFWSVLNLEHFGKVSFHHAFALFDPLKRRQADPGGASKLTLGSSPGASALTCGFCVAAPRDRRRFRR